PSFFSPGFWSRPAPLQYVDKERAKAPARVAGALVADDDPTRRQDQRNIPQAQTDTVIEPNQGTEEKPPRLLPTGAHESFPAVHLVGGPWSRRSFRMLRGSKLSLPDERNRVRR